MKVFSTSFARRAGAGFAALAILLSSQLLGIAAPAAHAAPVESNSYIPPLFLQAENYALAASVKSPSTAPSKAPTSRGQAIVSIAMQYVGYRYRFGGSSPSGFDCSGFVYYVLNKAGIPAGRTIPYQIDLGPRVSSSNLQPGDLVFFSNTYKAGLSHAGIYIGNGQFVHAENEDTGVRVSQLWNQYYSSHYTMAVRP